MVRISKLIAFVSISALLTACGGGSSSISGAAPGGSNPPPSGTGTVSLSWTAPATRTNGNPVSLSEIGGYKLYVGTSSGTYNPGIDVGNSTFYILSSLNPGTYYLALSAYDVNAQESGLSSEFPVTIN